MNSVEVSARTQEEAIEQALSQLDASISDVDVEILDEGSKGLFGLFGSRLARVRVTVKQASEDEDILSVLQEKKEAPKPAKKPKTAPAEKKEEAPKQEKKPAPEAPAPVKEEAPKPVEEKAAEVKAEEPAPEVKETRRPEPVRRTRAQAQTEEPRHEAPANREYQVLDKPEINMIPDDAVDPATPAGRARAFVQELTDLMGVHVQVHVGLDAEENIFIQMEGDTMGILIGRRGETLDAIQYLTSLRVNREHEGYIRVTLDTENYRAKREDTLIRLANRMANRAVKIGRRVSLEPMNPYERRIIHSALQSNTAVDTHSEGEEPNRHVVITLNR
ncbi:MAG: Jag N-terminal domain-containing protein [Clostridia bacterium]|nr:Jag N-terminal domain-containing protein [Clostridia bacterium]